MIPARFSYLRARSLEEALEALTEPDAYPLAGGQSLLPMMKLRLARPSLVVDVSAVLGRSVSVESNELHIGALVTWDALARTETVLEAQFRGLAECAYGIGDMQVRNSGTVGGGIAHADPASDMPAMCLALGTRMRVLSQAGEREVEAEEFFLGPFTTAIGRGELLTEVVVPSMPHGSASAYVSIEHPASGFALAGAGVLIRADGSKRVALTGLSGKPFVLDRPLCEIKVTSNHYASSEYRRALAQVAVRRALARAQVASSKTAA